jgi:hypothetical protein
MKKVALVPLILLVITAVAYARSYEVTKKAGPYTVIATIDKNPPVVGDNNISIEVKDSSGRDVTDARVSADYSMPAMPGMPAMNYKTNAALRGNSYQSRINLSMAGSWNVAVKVTRLGKTASMKFSIDAQ